MNEIEAKLKYMQLAYSAPNYGDNRYVVRTKQGQEMLGVNYLTVNRISVTDKCVFKKYSYDQIICANCDSNYITLTIAVEGQLVLQTGESAEIAGLITDYKAAMEEKRKKSTENDCCIQ
jgi:hypothetical protein